MKNIIVHENTNIVLDDSQAGLQSSNQSTVAVGILDCCRKFVDRCLSVHSKYTANSLKLANEIVNLMQDIGLSLSLQVSDYANLFKWTQTTFSGEYIGNAKFNFLRSLNLVIRSELNL